MKPFITAAIVGVIAITSSFAKEVGKPAPAFTAKSAKGTEISLANYKDKVVVLEWVNFDCPFVKKHYASKNMQALQAAYTGKGVIWLTINSSAEGKQGHLTAEKFVEKATAEGGKATELLLDADGKVGKAYDAKVTPHMMIISKDGNLAYSGAIDSTASTKAEDVAAADKLFANALDAVLAGKEVTNASNKPYGCGVKY
ncbi:MAG: redoxin domain-containing protein [Akkermansiaceae bacterium]|jgi:peroxiredoxin|nr:redoxin domain-containing protein [Luteolibacter sp.]